MDSHRAEPAFLRIGLAPIGAVTSALTSPRHRKRNGLGAGLRITDSCSFFGSGLRNRRTGRPRRHVVSLFAASTASDEVANRDLGSGSVASGIPVSLATISFTLDLSWSTPSSALRPPRLSGPNSEPSRFFANDRPAAVNRSQSPANSAGVAGLLPAGSRQVQAMPLLSGRRCGANSMS